MRQSVINLAAFCKSSFASTKLPEGGGKSFVRERKVLSTQLIPPSFILATQFCFSNLVLDEPFHDEKQPFCASDLSANIE